MNSTLTPTCDYYHKSGGQAKYALEFMFGGHDYTIRYHSCGTHLAYFTTTAIGYAEDGTVRTWKVGE